ALWGELRIGAEARQTMHLVRERWIVTVARGEDWRSDGPANGERRIVPRNPDFARGIVDVGALVLDLRGLADDAEAVREAWRHVDLLEVGGGQRNPDPPPERRRATADVDGDVEHFTLDHADELSLHVTELKVQPSNGLSS